MHSIPEENFQWKHCFTPFAIQLASRHKQESSAQCSAWNSEELRIDWIFEGADRV